MGEGPEGNKAVSGRTWTYAVPTGTAQVLVGANPRRNFVKLKAQAACTIGIGEQATTSLASLAVGAAGAGWPMAANDVIELRSYTGPIAAIAGSGTFLQVMEEMRSA